MSTPTPRMDALCKTRPQDMEFLPWVKEIIKLGLALERELQAASLDARRYRFLRDVYSAHEYRIFMSPRGQLREDMVDAAIAEYEAARAALSKEAGQHEGE